MNVSILSMTPAAQALLWAAAKTCKSKETPEDLFFGEQEDPQRLLKALWDAGHYSVFEHASITFAVSGISRTCLAQLSRHRHISLSVQSQRYVASNDPAIPGTLPVSVEMNPQATEVYMAAWVDVSRACDQLAKLGVPQEDVRFLYPGGTTTNLVLTCNLRAYSELRDKRTVKGAQWEIKDLIFAMDCEVKEALPWFGELLGLS